jgi:predicted RNA-binding protein with PIN domain
MSRAERWLVDGFNVLHAGVLRGNDRRGWWREEVRARLLERVAAFDDAAAELWVVFDGSGPAGGGEQASLRPRVVFAPSADEWLLGAVREAPDPAALVVVTADRQLADRARHRGARVVSPRAFLARCGAP